MISAVSDTLNWLFPMMMWFSSGPQYHPFPQHNLQKPIHFSARFGIDHNSNALNAEILRVISAGREVTPSMKDRSQKRLRTQNRIGLDVTGELSFVHFPSKFIGKDRSWGYYIGYKNRLTAFGKISPDTYKALFYGNSPYKGDTLFFSNEKVRYLAYQQLSFGLVHHVRGSGWTGNYGFALSYINASNFGDIRVRNASLYTSPDAFEVSARGNFDVFTNDASKPRYHYPNGWGLGADLFLNLQDPSGRNAISIQARDFGFVKSTAFGNGYALDTAISFDGVSFASPYDISGEVFTQLGDSAQRILNAARYSGSRVLPLPAQLSVSYHREFIPFRLYGSAQLSMRFFSGAMPMGTIRVWGYPDPQIMIGGNISYGGWGTYSVGVDLGFDIGRGWVFNLGTNQLQGLIAERSASGFGAYIGLWKSFSGQKNVKKNEKKK